MVVQLKRVTGLWISISIYMFARLSIAGRSIRYCRRVIETSAREVQVDYIFQTQIKRQVGTVTPARVNRSTYGRFSNLSFIYFAVRSGRVPTSQSRVERN